MSNHTSHRQLSTNGASYSSRYRDANTQGDNDVICYYSLWSVLPTPCCRATSRNRH